MVCKISAKSWEGLSGQAGHGLSIWNDDKKELDANAGNFLKMRKLLKNFIIKFNNGMDGSRNAEGGREKERR
jgi:hypothetical protein